MVLVGDASSDGDGDGVGGRGAGAGIGGRGIGEVVGGLVEQVFVPRVGSVFRGFLGRSHDAVEDIDAVMIGTIETVKTRLVR